MLTLSHCALTVFPPSISPLRHLKALVLNNNAITRLPTAFPHLPELNSLILSHNQLESLPTSLPASLPALKKLSLGHNKLRGESLPDFSLCLGLREVRLNDNPLVKLPAHVRSWGKGADGKTAPGLELLELKDCGLESWESLSTLAEAEEEKEAQPKLRRKGLTQLLLKGNGVEEQEGWREWILEVHPTLRVLDGVRIVPRTKAVQEDEGQGAKGKGVKKGRHEVEVEDSGAEEEDGDDDEPAQMAAEMRALRRGKEAFKSSSRKVRNDESDSEDEEDDDDAAQMAAEMRALRRGQAAPSRSDTKKDPSKPKPKSKQSPSKPASKKPHEQDTSDRTKPKHKRGTRSGKNVHKATDTTTPPANRKDNSFFEPVDAASEAARLAPIYELSKKKAKIVSGRTQVAEGVLEDASSQLSKARQKESKIRTELDTFDDSAPLVEKRSGGRKKAQEVQEKAEMQNTSVAAIVDLRKRDKKRKVDSADGDAKRTKKVKAALPFMVGDKKSGEFGGGDAWGAGGAWA